MAPNYKQEFTNIIRDSERRPYNHITDRLIAKKTTIYGLRPGLEYYMEYKKYLTNGIPLKGFGILNI